MVSNPTDGEMLLTMQIDATLLNLWQRTAVGTVAGILFRSSGEVHFYPSEAAELSEAALTGLPGANPNTGINVAQKFSSRFAAKAPN